ncbi:MAG: YkvA family protein [Pseudomonadota bacterium]
MTIVVKIKISSKDISALRRAMHAARQTIACADEADIVDAARTMLAEFDSRKAPDFVRERVPRLEAMVDMLEDEDWALPKRDREKILAALVYFCDPDDLIPDDVPGLGLLDDAIMIELLLMELKHVIEAYRDFTRYRASLLKTVPTDIREQRLEKRRWALHGRMSRRGKSDRSGLPERPLI